MKNFFFWLFLCGVTKIFGQPYIVESEGLGKYGYLDKNATTYIRLNSGSYGNIYQLFARTWTGSSHLTYGSPINSCGDSNVNQNTNNYSFASAMSPGSIAYTSVHADYCGGGNSYGGNPNDNTGFNEKNHYIFELTSRNSDLSSNVIVGNKNVVMSVKIDFGSLSDRKLQRFWIKNNGTFAETSEISNNGFKIYYEPATGSETFNRTESNATIYGNYAGNSTSNNEYGHDALDITIPAGGLRVYVVLENLAACSQGKTVSVNLLNDGLSFSPQPAANNTKTLARVNAIPASPTAISFSYPSTAITPTSQTVDLYAAPTNLSVSVVGATSYQWYRNASSNNTGGTAISGANSSTYMPPTGPSDDFNNPGTNYYYAIATTGVGSCDFVVSSLASVTVNNSTVANWANLQFPKVEQNLYEGIGVDVFAQVYINGSTPGIGQAPNVNAWIGYSTTNTNPNTWPSTQWVPAVYNSLQAFREDFNDEYWVDDFGKDLPAGTYYIASRFQKDGGAYIYGGVDGTTNNESGGTWNGTTYFNLKLNNNQIVTWDGNAWNNVSGPTINSPAIIAGDSASPSSFSAKNLTVNNGVNLIIPSGESVIVDYELINNNGVSNTKTVVVESDANFIQNHSSIANSGNMRVKRNASVPNIQYNFWSSPVSNQNLYTFYQSGNPVAPKSVFTYNTQTNYYNTVSSGNFTPGVGYSIKGESSGNSNAAFFGTPNNGNLSVNLDSRGDRYNLIGNPYPSNIDAIDFYLLNESQIENTFWFWDNTGNTAVSQMGTSYSGYSSNNFATYNVDAGVGNSGTGIQNNASKIPNGIIGVGQGFIVEAKNITNPSVVYNNDLRKTETSVFFAKQNQTKNAFWLQLTTPSQLTNTTVIVYKNEANNFLDKYDSELASVSSDALYSLVDDNTLKKLSIQGRSINQFLEDKVKLGINCFSDGMYTFSVKEKMGIFDNRQNIYLHDKLTKTYTDVNNNYTFFSKQGLYEDRFEIVYKDGTVLGQDITNKDQFMVYRDGNSFIVKSSEKLGKVELFDASGKLILTKTTKEKQISLDVTGLPNMIYIIRAENNKQPKTKKIIK